MRIISSQHSITYICKPMAACFRKRSSCEFRKFASCSSTAPLLTWSAPPPGTAHQCTLSNQVAEQFLFSEESPSSRSAPLSTAMRSTLWACSPRATKQCVTFGEATLSAPKGCLSVVFSSCRHFVRQNGSLGFSSRTRHPVPGTVVSNKHQFLSRGSLRKALNHSHGSKISKAWDFCGLHNVLCSSLVVGARVQ